ncbi:UEV domain-containing protein [Collybia nuda]|uniref:UEV domain-containing protein n=1 Tax=Collybia nuda TaxID=64659 RepID=A0A9P6CL91_9AGAR|nr:UEV domain-containing protein [Collybia nuda]
MNSGVESLTQKWLRQNVQSYTHSDRVYTDVHSLISRFNSLRPKSDVYTYDDGRTQLLLCVHGLLAISYRNASYNIPIAIWLTREHPRHPPIAYVVPTNDMLVKAGRYVDVSGKCSIDYLQNWARKSEGCDLSALVEAMQDHFSREPPVYAKPQKTTNPTPVPPNPVITTGSSQNLVQEYRDRPPLPLPPSPTYHNPINRDRPMIPPKPQLSTSHDVVRPFVSLLFAMFTSCNSQDPPSIQPPLPPRIDIGPPQYRISPPAPPPIPPQYPTLASGPFSRGHLDSSSPAVSLQTPTATWHQPSPPLPPMHSYSRTTGQSSYDALPQQVPAQVGAPTPIHPAPNFLDEDSSDNVQPIRSAPAPPRPPNPELLHLHNQVYEKLSSEIRSLSQALALDGERLRAHQMDLLSGEPAIRDEMARLEAVRDVCRNVSGRLKGTVTQAEVNIAELRRKGDPEVDELVCSTTIVHNQLITLVAEDNAIEDTIYHLHRALNAGRIDLERFLRSTRSLAEEQFMKRALIEKIQVGIPMGMSMGSRWS